MEDLCVRKQPHQHEHVDREQQCSNDQQAKNLRRFQRNLRLDQLFDQSEALHQSSFASFLPFMNSFGAINKRRIKCVERTQDFAWKRY